MLREFLAASASFCFLLRTLPPVLVGLFRKAETALALALMEELMVGAVSPVFVSFLFPLSFSPADSPDPARQSGPPLPVPLLAPGPVVEPSQRPSAAHWQSGRGWRSPSDLLLFSSALAGGEKETQMEGCLVTNRTQYEADSQ